MAAPVVNLFSAKHNGISGMNTQLMCQHSGETPLRGGIARSLTNASNADFSWQASWPSFVDPIERVRQIAWPNSAWTQGYANPYSIGLECAGYARFSKADWLTSAGLKQLENLAHEWVYYLKKEQKAGNDIPRRWLSTPEVQKVMAGNRSIKGFCTHAQIDPASRTDPGPNFPYDRLMTRIKQLMGDISTASTPTTQTDMERLFAMFKDKEEFGRFLRANGVGYENDKVKASHGYDMFGMAYRSLEILERLEKQVAKLTPEAIAEAVAGRKVVSRAEGSEGETFRWDTYESVNNQILHALNGAFPVMLEILNSLLAGQEELTQAQRSAFADKLEGLEFQLVQVETLEEAEEANEAQAEIVAASVAEEVKAIEAAHAEPLESKVAEEAAK